jgi:hypothetical protein
MVTIQFPGNDEDNPYTGTYQIDQYGTWSVIKQGRSKVLDDSAITLLQTMMSQAGFFRTTPFFAQPSILQKLEYIKENTRISVTGIEKLRLWYRKNRKSNYVY